MSGIIAMSGIITKTRTSALVLVSVVGLLGLLWGGFSTVGYAAGEVLLTGTVTSAAGEKMEGVTVSARQVGTTFTTSVFTDTEGEYYFPRLEAGAYKVWAQATGFDAAIADVILAGPVHRQDAVLEPLANFERQLRGDEWLDSLPTQTDQDKKMKEVFKMACLGGCHAPGHVLINRFDDRGWKNWIDLMSGVWSYGRYEVGEDLNMAPISHYFRDELAAYLAKARGPMPSGVPLKVRPRPRGVEALAVFREYDTVPPGLGLPLYNDSSLWQLGPANKTDDRNRGGPRGTVDADGNPWVSNPMNPNRTLMRIDWNTGKVTNYKVTLPSGRAASTGEIFADREGVVWTRTQGHLVRVDRAGKLDLIPMPPRASVPPATPAPPSGGEQNLHVWWEAPQPAECANGICHNPPVLFWMYEPKTGRWAVYENSEEIADAQGNFPEPYNITSGGDADGNGWWAQFGTDVIVKADGKRPGKVYSFQVPPPKNPVWDLFKGDDRKIFEMVGGPDPHGRGVPFRHVFRMIGAGPGPTDSAWVSGWFTGDLVRINIRTHEMTVYKSPYGTDCYSYAEYVDPEGMVWSICQSTDVFRRFDPKTERWSRFSIPTLNVDAHAMGVSPMLVNGRVRIMAPSMSNSKAVVMDVRTEEDVAALRDEVQKAMGAQ